MIIYPAIDLIGGNAVRLEQGDYDKKTQYSADPSAIAEQFAADGAQYIHIVDLDGAKAKKPINLQAIKAIAKRVNLPLQVGGGIRSVEDADQVLEYANRVIIGTVAVTEKTILKDMLTKFGPGKVVVSVDYKNDVPAVNGWLEEVSITTDELQADLKVSGVKTVIITDTNKDGLMGGPNIELMVQWKQAGFEVICAGGVTTASDIKTLSASGIDGAIIGKALYENKITLKEAIDAGK